MCDGLFFVGGLCVDLSVCVDRLWLSTCAIGVFFFDLFVVCQLID